MVGKHGVLLLCLALLSCDVRAPSHPDAATGRQTREPAALAPAIDFTATSLFDVFFDDAESAEANFKGKLLRVEGTIRAVRPIEGKPSVELYVPRDNNVHTIRCLFGLQEEADVNGLVSGHKVIIRGTCAGIRENHVILEDCFIAVKDVR